MTPVRLHSFALHSFALHSGPDTPFTFVFICQPIDSMRLPTWVPLFLTSVVLHTDRAARRN